MRSRVDDGEAGVLRPRPGPAEFGGQPVEEGSHGDGLDPVGRRREPGQVLGRIRIGPPVAVEDEVHAPGGDDVVVDDQLVVDPDQVEHQGGQHSRAVLARRAVEHERQPRRVADEAERLDQGLPADVEVPAIALGEILAGRGGGSDGLARDVLTVVVLIACAARQARTDVFPVADHREVMEADGLGLETAASGAGQLLRGPEIDHRGEPEGPQDLDVALGELVEGVAAEQSSPLRGSTVAGRITPEVTEVESALEGHQSLGNGHRPIMPARAGRPSRPAGTV